MSVKYTLEFYTIKRPKMIYIWSKIPAKQKGGENNVTKN